MIIVRIDERGFVWAGEYKLPVKYDPDREVLIFHDKDRRRSTEKGTDQIEIPISVFAVDLIMFKTEDNSDVLEV